MDTQTAPDRHREYSGPSTAIFYQLLLVAFLLISVLLLFTLTQKPKEVGRNRNVKPCCLGLVSRLALTVNRSISACLNFFDHTCHSYSRRETPGSLHYKQFPSAESLHLTSTTPAGRLLNTYFRTCVSAMHNTGTRGSDAVEALVEATKLSGFVNRERMLRLLMELNLTYNVKVIVTFTTENLQGLYLQQGMGSLRIEAQPIRFNDRDEFRNLRDQDMPGLLAAVNTALSSNLSVLTLESLADELSKTSIEPHDISNMTVLGSIVVGYSAADIKNSLENINELPISGQSVFHSSIEAIKTRLAIMLDPSRQPSTVALLLVEAVLDLLSPMYSSLDTSTSHHTYFQHCESQTWYLIPVIALDILQKHNVGPEHDAELRSIFAKLVTTIADTAAAVIEPTDAQRLRNLLQGMRLLLPDDVYPPNLTLPESDERFFVSHLRFTKLRLTELNYRVPSGVEATAVLLLFDVKAGILRNSIVVNLYLYVVFSISRDIESLVPMSVVGVAVADALWEVVFEAEWGKETSQVFRNYAHCISAEGSVTKKRLQFPRLSIASCAQTVMGTNWNDLFPGWGLWKVSRAQIF